MDMLPSRRLVCLPALQDKVYRLILQGALTSKNDWYKIEPRSGHAANFVKDLITIQGTGILQKDVEDLVGQSVKFALEAFRKAAIPISTRNLAADIQSLDQAIHGFSVTIGPRLSFQFSDCVFASYADVAGTMSRRILWEPFAMVRAKVGD